jgi:hypothetical protein
VIKSNLIPAIFGAACVQTLHVGRPNIAIATLVERINDMLIAGGFPMRSIRETIEERY